MNSQSAGRVLWQINHLTAALIELGICDDQNSAFYRETTKDQSEVTFAGTWALNVALKDWDYDDVHSRLLEARAYNMKLLDGALIQMMYDFHGETLLRHRLAFFPSPSLKPFQEEPELYMQDAMFLEIVARRIVPFPIRFDFDGREAVYEPVSHPKSHLTLGQYENCRIPVTAPVSPYWFLDFLLRNFYNTAFSQIADKLPAEQEAFNETIFPEERRIVHLCVPTE
ncbi:DUF2290 domain-containing protein [Thiohalocapsa marina]|uniref:DUF2290 domain-containing protein n=1 Tax=Thiohalocapsa marina TaxID=424902 RepID=UPI0036DE9E8E